MTVGFNLSKQAPARLTSLTVDKFLKSQKNLSKPSPKLWPNDPQLRIPASGNNQQHPPPILQTLESCTSFNKFHQIHAQLLVSGLLQHPPVAIRVVRKLCNYLHSVSHALLVFDCIREPDTFLCNVILNGLLSLDPFSALSFYYEKMVGKSVKHNEYTFPLLGKICADIKSLEEGRKVHAWVLKLGFQSDLFVKNSFIRLYSVCGQIGSAREVFDDGFVLDLVSWNSMIDGYVKNGQVGIARELFDEMPERDTFSWNIIIAGYVGVGKMEVARELFEKMPFRDVISWNSMIDGYARIENVSEARNLFDRMPERNIVSWNIMLALYVRCKKFVNHGLMLFDTMMERGEARPNSASLVSVLIACATLGRLDKGLWVHSLIENNKIKCDVLLSTALLTMYAKCGAMDLARDVFDNMPDKNVVSWNSMIMGYGVHGYAEKALDIFIDMEKRGQVPNASTFTSCLSACKYSGKVLEGWWCFDLMCRVYQIEPKVEHVGCMFDLLSRVGFMEQSKGLMSKMPLESGPALWKALLSSCRTLSNLELGKVIAKQLIDLELTDVGPYVLLSYIYSLERKWGEVENIRKFIKDREFSERMYMQVKE
ncbi:pentatricopeptide repeat-containing protein At3g29230-like isoform X2 [Hibiscus syriacus]|uniref:pentatricopeptide repeat-containing protein At3g29230-like isoform X2 n=1 Tax=Hibiscus syriacus TaxID=106335 RepID=UPI001920BE02|nr:pentatricopeptide repeat-containing protein At3g29230-like isoform X2 [Hibiscus syriacus]